MILNKSEREVFFSIFEDNKELFCSMSKMESMELANLYIMTKEGKRLYVSSVELGSLRRDSNQEVNYVISFYNTAGTKVPYQDFFDNISTSVQELLLYHIDLTSR